MQLFNQFNKSTKRYPNLDTAEGSTLRAYGNIKKNLKEGLFCSIKNAEETYAYFGCFGVKKSLVHSFSTHNKGDLKQVISVVRSYKPVTPSLRHRVVISPQICKKSWSEWENPALVNILGLALVMYGYSWKNYLKEQKYLQKAVMTKISQAPNTLRKRLPSFNSGRNNQGRITIRHRVGDHKKLYPLNDYQQRLGIYSLRQLVTKIIYSPYHTSWIAEVQVIVEPSLGPSGLERWETYPEDKKTEGRLWPKRLINKWAKDETKIATHKNLVMTKSFYSPLGLRYRKLAAEGIIPGAIINPPKHGANSSLSRILNPIQLDLNHKTLAERHSDALHVEIGMTRALKEIPAGSSIFNLEKRPNKGGIYARAAGTSCILLKTQEIFVPNLQSPEVNKTRLMHCVIRLPSKKVIVLSGDCRAIIGQASNKDHSKRVLGKAGASRWVGRRPVVRGEAMNPVDHPHGGKSHGSGGLGNPPKTKWGKLAKWQHTRKKHVLKGI